MTIHNVRNCRWLERPSLNRTVMVKPRTMYASELRSEESWLATRRHRPPRAAQKSRNEASTDPRSARYRWWSTRGCTPAAQGRGPSTDPGGRPSCSGERCSLHTGEKWAPPSMGSDPKWGSGAPTSLATECLQVEDRVAAASSSRSAEVSSSRTCCR